MMHYSFTLVWLLLALNHLTLKPLGTRIIGLVQNAPHFTLTVPSWTATRTTTPLGRITKHVPIINVKVRIAIVGVKSITKGASIVANEFFFAVARWEASFVARSKRVEGFVVANVSVGIENVKDAGLECCC